VSEHNLETTPEGKMSDNQPDSEQFEEFVVKVNRETNEIVFKNPRTGTETALKPKVETKSLTVSEFSDVWQRLNKLGITWTTEKRDADFWKEFSAIQDEFPTFPRELGTAVLHALLGPRPGESQNEKALIIKDLLTQKYRSEFFFKYAVKVPYFEDIDWEIVIKAQERNVTLMPKIAYALLMLSFTDPVDPSISVEEAANEVRDPEFMTVAVNEDAIDRLVEKLMTIRAALVKTQKIAESLTEQEESSNGIGTEKK
jgi:hypothetical protein